MYLQVILSVIHDWNSITIDSQVWRHHLIHKRSNIQFDRLSNLCRNILVSTELGYMDKANQAISIETGRSSNMVGLSTSKKEREIARILATKFHTELAIKPRLEARINPIMRDLIINR